MFYAHYVLSKKGPLAKVWLAAHWDKKLTKAHVFETDVQKTVDNIISPKVKMALRTSGHLLLGVVRIYSRKQKYLIQDLGEACAKIKMAFRPGMVDLPVEGTVANTDMITLPEIFHDLESAVADLHDIDEQMVMHRSRVEEITLKDDYVSSSGGMFGLEDDFQWGDNEFGGMLEDIEVARRSTGGGHEQSHVSDVSTIGGELNQQNTITDKLAPPTDGNQDLLGDGFGDFGQGGLQDLDMPGLDMPGLEDINLDPPSLPPPQDMEVDQPPAPAPPEANVEGEKQQDNEEDAPLIPPNDTIREDSGFILEPLDTPYRMRQRRKRKLVVDPRKELTGDVIRSQLRDSSDILQLKLIPPPSKKALLWKEYGATDYLLHNPSIPCLSLELVHLVNCNLDKDIGDDVIPADTTLLDLEELEIENPRSVGIEANDPPSVPPLEDDRGDEDVPPRNDEMDELPPPNDFIDNIDLDGGGLMDDPLVPVMPDLEAEVEENEVEGGIATTQSTAEQEGSERTEEFEQRRWNKRSQQVLNMLEKGFESSESIQFSLLTKRCTRKVAASRFYTCLLLGKEGAIKFTQSKPFDPIIITKGQLSSAVALS